MRLWPAAIILSAALLLRPQVLRFYWRATGQWPMSTNLYDRPATIRVVYCSKTPIYHAHHDMLGSQRQHDHWQTKKNSTILKQYRAISLNKIDVLSLCSESHNARNCCYCWCVYCFSLDSSNSEQYEMIVCVSCFLLSRFALLSHATRQIPSAHKGIIAHWQPRRQVKGFREN